MKGVVVVAVSPEQFHSERAVSLLLFSEDDGLEVGEVFEGGHMRGRPWRV